MGLRVQKKDVPAQHFRAMFVPETLNKDARTIEVVWTTGARVLRNDWYGEPFQEELSLDPTHVRMGRMENGANVLAVHDRWSLLSILGVVEKAWLTPTEGRAIIRFSERADVEPIWKDVCAGIIRHLSVGYNVFKYMQVAPEGSNSEGTTYPILRAIDWEPFEISFLAVEADTGASTRAKPEQLTSCEILLLPTSAESAAQPNKETRDMKTGQQSKGANTTATPAEDSAQNEQHQTVDVSAHERAAAEAERTRGMSIRKEVRIAQLDDSFADELVEKGVSLDQARAQIIEKWGKDQPAKTKSHHVEVGGQDETVTRIRGLENAILHRLDSQKHKLEEVGQRFRGMTLLRVCEEVVGVERARGMARHEIAQRALTTSDFPIVLANIARKRLRDGYDVLPITFKPFVRYGTLPDYKELSVIQFGTAPSLKEVKEGGEYQEGTFGEGAEKVRVKKHGIIINITEETMVNDDLQALSKVPFGFGNSAARLELNLVYGILTGNPVMADNVALFHATHGNLGSAAAVGETGVSEMRTKMRNQKDIDKKDFLRLAPKVLIVGPDKETEAQKFLSTIVAQQTGNVNVFANSMALCVDPLITGNQWFGAADPNQVDTIEVDYLEGMEGPQVESREKFEKDTVQIKCKHVVGAKAIDYRGLFKNPGA